MATIGPIGFLPSLPDDVTIEEIFAGSLLSSSHRLGIGCRGSANQPLDSNFRVSLIGVRFSWETNMAKRKVTITCAVAGAIHTPSMSPHLPVTPEEIVEASIGAAEAGAARSNTSGSFSPV
jgi:hypothetical protein